MNDPVNQAPAPSEDTPGVEIVPVSTNPPSPHPTVSPEQKEERNWALIAHLSSLSSFVGIPGFVGPLVVWLVKKDELPFASAQAKEALNFQISLFLYAIACIVLTFTIIGAVIGIPGLFALGIIEIVFTIIASIKAGEGNAYRYPMTIRLID